MKIREPQKPEAERITRQLWLPLAQEMEKTSSYNQLKQELDIEACIEHKKKGIREKGEYMFIAEDRKLLAFISATMKETPPVFQRGDKIKINELYVKPHARRQGIATKLIKKIEKQAEKQKCDTLELDVNTVNTAAKQTYRKNNFQTERERMIKKM